MSRPPLEVADLVRAAGDAFIERSRTWITWKHVKVLLAIARCRTAALGGHLDECTRCGHRAISYNSCRNRHCPKCQAGARDRWLAARRQELLPTRYVHVVFTLPHELAPLALQNKKVIYDLLFRTSAETLLEIARDPKHLGAEIGFFSVLHTWNQKLELHPHVHCVVPAGGPSARSHPLDQITLRVLSSRQGARPCFSRQVCCGSPARLSGWPARFPRKPDAPRSAENFAAWLRPLFRNDWVVYSKRPFGGPEHVLRYLGRYTHRVAISNHRLVSFADGKVTFRWRDSAHNNEQKLMTLSLDEFLRRFLLHLLPKGFVRIRHFGFLANRKRATLLPLCFQLFGSAQPPQAEPHASSTARLARSLALPEMRWTDGGHRKAHHCRNSTSFSTSDHRYRMKLLSPISKTLRASARSTLCALPPNRSLLPPSSTTVFAILFRRDQFPTVACYLSCSAAQSRHGLMPLLPTIEFP